MFNLTFRKKPAIKKDLFLHVGLHKTATSSIQNFLMKNRVKLKGEILYVKTFLDQNGAHHPLFNILRSTKKDPEHVLKKWNKSLSRLVDVSYSRFNKSDKILLSSELVTELLINNRNLELLSNLNEQFNVIPIIYLRRQDKLKLSVFNQITLHSLNTKSFNQENHYIYDFVALLDRLSGVFDQQRFIINVYDDASEINIVKEFIALLEVSSEGLKFSHHRFNASLKPQVVELKRLINQLNNIKSYDEKLRYTLKSISKDSEVNEIDYKIAIDKEWLSECNSSNLSLLEKYNVLNKHRLFIDKDSIQLDTISSESKLKAADILKLSHLIAASDKDLHAQITKDIKLSQIESSQNDISTLKAFLIE